MTSGTTITTDYAGNYIYENGSLQFFHTPEGYVEPINASNYTLGFRHTFQYKDHLGNIRLSYKDLNQNTGAISLSIVEENNYYPFGLKHKGYNGTVNGREHKYKYNGKELQEELDLNWYDLGARNLDHALGRFMNVDPRSEQYNFQSSYAFANNNPIFFVDINGEGVLTDYKLDKKTGDIRRVDENDGSEKNKNDRLYATDDEGNVDENKSVTVNKNNKDDSTIISRLSVNFGEIELQDKTQGKASLSFAVAESIDANDVFKVFKFAADKSEVEWSVSKIDFSGSQIYNIGTYHNQNISPGAVTKGGTIIGTVHSHPGIQLYYNSNGSVDWQKSQERSMGKDGVIVVNHKITSPYYIYFPQTKQIRGLKYYNKGLDYYSSPKSFKF